MGPLLRRLERHGVRRLRRRGRVPAPRRSRGPELLGGGRRARRRGAGQRQALLVQRLRARRREHPVPAADGERAERVVRPDGLRGPRRGRVAPGHVPRGRGQVPGPERLRLRGLLHGQPHGLPVLPGRVRLGPREAVPHAQVRPHAHRLPAGGPAALPGLDLRRVHAQVRLRARVRDQVADGLLPGGAGHRRRRHAREALPRREPAVLPLRPRRGRRRRRLRGRGRRHVRVDGGRLERRRDGVRVRARRGRRRAAVGAAVLPEPGPPRRREGLPLYARRGVQLD